MLSRGAQFQALDAQDGSIFPAARRVPAQVWMDGLLTKQYLVKWNQNDAADVSHLPDLAPLPFHLAPKQQDDDGAMAGSILYFASRSVFQAVDVETGAVLGWWPCGDTFGSWVGTDPGHVYLAAADGSVRAFPLFPVPAG